MAIGPVQDFNQAINLITADAERQWDDATAGHIMWCLADETYTLDLTDTTTTDIGAALQTTGDATPVNATTLSIDNTSTPGTTKYKSDNANFGATTTITGVKWLIAVSPVVAGTFSATTSRLLLIIDLNTASASATISSSNDEFVINMPTDGWFKIARA